MRMKMVATIFAGVALAVCAGLARPQVAPQAQTPSQAAKAPDSIDASAMKAMLEAREKQLKDWPNLARYREANSLAADPEKNEQRVVFLGDSITDAWARPQFGGFFPDKPYYDRGISGQTTPQMLIRFRPDVLALQPRVVVILAGTNDLAGNTGPMSLAETEGNLASMAELAKANGVRVVLASVLPVSNYGRDGGGNSIDMRIKRPPEKILELNAWIKKYAAENGHIYLDYFAAMVDELGLLKKELSNDGLHPNAAGYAIMGPLAEQAIAEALKK